MLVGFQASLVRLAWPLCAVSKETIGIVARVWSLTNEMFVMAPRRRKFAAAFLEVDAQLVKIDRL